MDKITFTGVGLKAYSGISGKGKPYRFVALRGNTEDGRTVRVVVSDPMLYAVIVGGASPLDAIEAVGTVTSRSFVGADGADVTVNETVNPVPTGLKPSAFRTDASWPKFPATPVEAVASTEAAF